MSTFKLESQHILTKSDAITILVSTCSEARVWSRWVCGATEDLFGSRRVRLGSILRNWPPCLSPRGLSGSWAASPVRGSTGSKIALENETRENRFGPGQEMRSIRQFESRAGIVIEKIRTYATVDGKIYWCSLNFWAQPQNLQNYWGGQARCYKQKGQGVPDNNFEEFTRQT